jgi:hypothetical protein
MGQRRSENRDLAAFEVIARRLRLTGEAGRYGPGQHLAVTPNREQEDLAARLVMASLRALASALAGGWTTRLSVGELAERSRPRVWGTKLQRAVVSVSSGAMPDGIEPVGIEPVGAFVGLPLSLTLGRPLVPLIAGESGVLVRRSWPAENPNRAARRALARQLIAQEAGLWEIAAAYGGPSPTLPFAARVRALRWWWEPDSGRQPAETICLRCGWEMVTRAMRSGPPFCDHCRKDKTLQRKNAIAPAERGTWWLRCSAAGCSSAFVGRPQARRCRRHRLAGIAPSKRPAR